MRGKQRIYMGYDPREKVAYDVARHSIFKHSGAVKLVQVFPVALDNPQVAEFVKRPVETRDGKLWCPISNAPMATEFACSRFVVPWLARHKGFAVFMDCDVLLRADVAELFALADPQYAVQVVKHKQESGPDVKMDGQVQTYYGRKNWSSVVLWNCDHPSHANFTLDDLNTRPGRWLHAFSWLKDEEIGELPHEWNYLVGVDPPEDSGSAKLLHYTLGGPWFPNWKESYGDEAWLAERKLIGDVR
jgi:hypothetical protein